MRFERLKSKKNNLRNRYYLLECEYYKRNLCSEEAKVDVQKIIFFDDLSLGEKPVRTSGDCSLE